MNARVETLQQPDLPLPERILAALSKATSKHPARATDVLARIGGDESAFWVAIKLLFAQRRLYSAHIQRQGDAEPWLAIWPTGVCLPVPTMSGNSLSSLFVKPRPGDLHAAYAPRSAPAPAAVPVSAAAPALNPTQQEPDMDSPTNEPRARGTLQSAITRQVQGRDKAAALTTSDIANLLCDTPPNIRFALNAMVDKGALLKTEILNGGRKVAAFYDPATEPRAPEKPAVVDTVAAGLTALADVIAAAEPEPEPEPEPVPSAVDRRAPQALYRAGDITVTEIPAADPGPRFALWDDGTLTITDGDDILQYGPDATRRLALLLGVPANTAVSNLGA